MLNAVILLVMQIGVVAMNTLYLQNTYLFQYTNDGEDLDTSQNTVLLGFLVLIANTCYLTFTPSLMNALTFSTSVINTCAILAFGGYMLAILVSYGEYQDNLMGRKEDYYLSLNQNINTINAIISALVLVVSLINASLQFIIVWHLIKHVLGYDPIILT